jgi:hypothetical protein
LEEVEHAHGIGPLGAEDHVRIVEHYLYNPRNGTEKRFVKAPEEWSLVKHLLTNVIVHVLNDGHWKLVHEIDVVDPFSIVPEETVVLENFLLKKLRRIDVTLQEIFTNQTAH